jgi:hypothetical protein
MSANILTVFNDQFTEFVNDVQNVFPDDTDVLAAKNALIAIRKANPRLLVNIWLNQVYLPYKDEIDNGNIDFFLNKDYADDFSNNNKSDKIVSSINRLKTPIRNMGPENQAKTMKYIQLLSKLSQMVK